MSRSVLLQLARDSISEVLQAKRLIDKKNLLEQHPLLAQKIQTTIKIYLDNELYSSCSGTETNSLLDNIIYCAKKALFESSDATPPLTLSQYLHSQLEITLFYDNKIMTEKDEALFIYS